jgi:hypothetical protein
LEEISAVYALEEDRVVIFFKVDDQFFVCPGTHDIGSRDTEAFVAGISLVIMYLFAILLEFFSLAASIFKAMKMNLHAYFRERPDLEIHFKCPAIIRGIGYVERNNVQVILQTQVKIFM